MKISRRFDTTNRVLTFLFPFFGLVCFVSGCLPGLVKEHSLHDNAESVSLLGMGHIIYRKGLYDLLEFEHVGFHGPYRSQDLLRELNESGDKPKSLELMCNPVLSRREREEVSRFFMTNGVSVSVSESTSIPLDYYSFLLSNESRLSRESRKPCLDVVVTKDAVSIGGQKVGLEVLKAGGEDSSVEDVKRISTAMPDVHLERYSIRVLCDGLSRFAEFSRIVKDLECMNCFDIQFQVQPGRTVRIRWQEGLGTPLALFGRRRRVFIDERWMRLMSPEGTYTELIVGDPDELFAQRTFDSRTLVLSCDYDISFERFNSFVVEAAQHGIDVLCVNQTYSRIETGMRSRKGSVCSDEQ